MRDGLRTMVEGIAAFDSEVGAANGPKMSYV
jgi:hypothetical protein